MLSLAESETKNLAGLKHSNKDRIYQKKACNNSLNINITGDYLERDNSHSSTNITALHISILEFSS
jgi:hypothetical protein